MKPSIITIAIVYLLILASGCSKNEMIVYEEKPSVYFSEISNEDSLVYSFAGKTIASDTIYLDLKLLGNKLKANKKYKIQVNDAGTTAKESLHYKKIEEFYSFPVDEFATKLPIIVYNTDPALANKSVALSLSIVSTDELNKGYPTNTTAHIIITNQLVKPIYWDDLLIIYYGEYSKVKHEICIRLQGHDFSPTQAIATAPPYSYAYWMSYGRVAAKYFADNVVYDENDNRIMPWAAF